MRSAIVSANGPLRMSLIMLRKFLLSCVTVLVLPFDTSAENWPGWRGPRGDGTSAAQRFPLQWNGANGQNIAWKVAIPGEGHASPIIFADRIFLVTCLLDSKDRQLICLDRQSGEILWRKNVFRAPLESKHALNSYASGTPVTDGHLVYVAFLEVVGDTVPAPNVGGNRQITPGKVVVAAFDFDGNQKWKVTPGEFVSAHGFSSCPVLYKELVIVNGDHDGDSYIVALNKSTGETVWKTKRQNGIRSYVTPLIREIDGRTQMVVSGSECIVSFNPDTGTRYWTIDGPTEQFVASMVFDGHKFYMAAGFPTYHVMGILPTGKGNVTQSHVAWHARNAKCYVPSPVIVNNYLIVADDRGTANCFDTASGDRHWQERLGKHYSASLLTAGGLVFLTADDGITKIIRPGEELNVIAENELGENCFSSPALAHNQLFVRGEKHLFCIDSDKLTGE